MCSGGVLEVDSVTAIGWCHSVVVGLVVLTVECAVVVIIKDNRWEIVEDVVDMVVFAELWVGGLTINSSNNQDGFMVCISSWELTSRSGTGRSSFNSPPLIEMMSFCNILSIVSLSIWLSMTCKM